MKIPKKIEEPIRMRFLSSTGPGLTWDSRYEIRPTATGVEYLSTPDIEEFEMGSAGTWKHPFEYRQVMVQISELDEFTSHSTLLFEPYIEGAHPFWEPFLVISMAEEYCYLVPELMQCSDSLLIRLSKILCREKRPDWGQVEHLHLIADALVELDSELSWSTYLRNTAKKGELDLEQLHQSLGAKIQETRQAEAIAMELRQSEYERQRNEYELEKQQTLETFRKEYDFYISHFEEFADRPLDPYLKDAFKGHLIDQLVENQRLPEEPIYVYRQGIYIRVNAWRFLTNPHAELRQNESICCRIDLESLHRRLLEVLDQNKQDS
jgi:hypothetical protein